VNTVDKGGKDVEKTICKPLELPTKEEIK